MCYDTALSRLSRLPAVPPRKRTTYSTVEKEKGCSWRLLEMHDDSGQPEPDSLGQGHRCDSDSSS
jgi:hypothetical protein